jgi:acetolactate decarboxylase
MFRKINNLLILCVLLLCNACAQAVPSPSLESETLYQVSSIDSLFSGHYDGIESLAWMKAHGDLGIGTFNSLDGELIMLDGKVYQSRSDGKLLEPPDTMTVPFANVTHFDRDLTFQVAQVADVATLQQLMVEKMPRKDAFYAIRVDATFSHVKVRTVPFQTKPYIALEEILKTQSVFEAENIKGSVVGFWSPDYVGKLNLPGYNLHFISDDRQFGGHLVEGVLSDVTISLDETRNFSVTLDPQVR